MNYGMSGLVGYGNTGSYSSHRLILISQAHARITDSGSSQDASKKLHTAMNPGNMYAALSYATFKAHDKIVTQVSLGQASVFLFSNLQTQKLNARSRSIRIGLVCIVDLKMKIEWTKSDFSLKKMKNLPAQKNPTIR